jgi:small-conductance mechanosensitive channel
MVSHYTAIYLGAVGLTGVLLIGWSRLKLRKAQYTKRRRIVSFDDFETIKTTTPIDNPVQQARLAAVQNIENRFSIIRRLSYYSIVLLWIVALIFPFLNAVPATFISILVASSGIILGVAARPYIENLISGIVISLSQPIRIGDTVLVDDNYGTVEDISMTHTVIKIWNWRRYVIPNSIMLSKELINCTMHDTYQWTHVEFCISYESDIRLVEQLAIAAARNSKHFADYEEPSFWVMNMQERSYTCWIAAWSDSPMDAWELKNDMRTDLIRQFQAHGIKTHRLDIDSSEKDATPACRPV